MDQEWVPNTPDADALIHCYHDHRIAMSLAVLGCVKDRVCITDQRCVDKTYPEFWDHATTNLGLSYQVYDPKSGSEGGDKDKLTKPASVVLTGMRAAGKTTLAQAGRDGFGLEMVDMDHVFKAKKGMEIKDFVASCGGEFSEFRAIEARLLLEAYQEHPTGAIIACGGGIVETEEGRDALRAAPGAIVWCQRPIDDIVAFLEEIALKDPARPSIGDVREVYARREPHFRASATHVFSMGSGEDGGLEASALEFGRFLKAVLHGSPEVLKPGTFCLSLTFPDVKQVLPMVSAITEGADAWELRADLLADTTDEGLIRAISTLRRASALPILFTVRSKAQGGQFTGAPERALEMLQLGIRAGCELVDVERDLLDGRALVEIAAQKGKCLVVCSHHEWQPKVVKSHVFAADLTSCAKTGVDLAKVVWMASRGSDCTSVREAVSSTGLQIPCIALLMGEAGKLSRVLNSVMTLVTHDDLAVAAPGQMTAQKVCELRQTLGLEGELDYPAATSKSSQDEVGTAGSVQQSSSKRECFGYYPFQ